VDAQAALRLFALLSAQLPEQQIVNPVAENQHRREKKDGVQPVLLGENEWAHRASIASTSFSWTRKLHIKNYM
jgi:hypothetical protein